MVKFAITLPIGRDVASIADRQNVDIRRVAQFLDNFEGRGFLSLDAERVDRIDDFKTSVGPKLAH